MSFLLEETSKGEANNNVVAGARSSQLKRKANDSKRESRQLTARRKKEFGPSISKWRVTSVCSVLH
jgi:hypothetical protein